VRANQNLKTTLSFQTPERLPHWQYALATTPQNAEVTPFSCSVALVTLLGRVARGRQGRTRAIILKEDVKVTLIVAAVVVRLGGAANSLAQQGLLLLSALLLGALLLELSGLAAESGVAGLLFGGHDVELAGEAALVAGVAGSAVRVLVRGQGFRMAGDLTQS
jgi:hypothetical protein